MFVLESQFIEDGYMLYNITQRLITFEYLVKLRGTPKS